MVNKIYITNESTHKSALGHQRQLRNDECEAHLAFLSVHRGVAYIVLSLLISPCVQEALHDGFVTIVSSQ